MVIADLSNDSAIIHSVIAAAPRAQPRNIRPDKENSAVGWNLPGFGAKARIRTTFGDLPIEALRLRDTLRTVSGGIARVQWVDQIHLDEDFISKHSSARPIRIPANAFGAGRPMQEMIVSPCQDVCSDAHVASQFLPAKDLSSRFNAHRLPFDGLTYFRFHCGEPVVVQVEGVWVRVLP